MSRSRQERSIAAESAVRLARTFCAAQSLDVAVTEYGGLLKSAVCTLTDPCGTPHVGKGKGIGAQAMASALFEAIEHRQYELDRRAVTPSSHKAIDKAGADAAFFNGSPRLDLFPGIEDVPFTRIVFDSLSDGGALDYPAFLTHPRFRSTSETEERFIGAARLRRYSTNSGTASGANRREAILHGLLELVERDALSMQLLRAVFKKDAEAVRVINVDSLPRDLQELCALAATEGRATLRLFDMTSDIGIPACLAELRQLQAPHETYFGSGASLSAMYGIERAVLEALQGLHVYNFELERPRLAHELRERRLTNFQRCLLEYGIFAYRGGSVQVDADALTVNDAGRSPDKLDDQIAVILGKLRATGIEAYSRTIHDGTVCVEQVVAPRLERFFLVSTGLILAPGGRGAAVVAG